MVIANDHYQSIGIVCLFSNQGAFNVSRVSGRSALILLMVGFVRFFGKNVGFGLDTVFLVNALSTSL